MYVPLEISVKNVEKAREFSRGEIHDGLETVIRKAFTKAERQFKKLGEKTA